MAVKYTLLTRANIRLMRVGESITEFGISASRLENGDVKYSVNVMVDRRRIHRVIGCESDGVTRSQAEEFIEAARTDARAGRLNLPVGRKLHRGFSDAADEYITLLRATDGKNISKKVSHLRLHLKPYFKADPIDNISGDRVLAYAKHRRALKAAEATINRELSTLSHFYRTAVRAKWIDAASIPQIVKAEEPLKPMVTLTPGQAADLMAAAVADQDPDMALFVGFGLNAAMRHSEITRSKFAHFDFDRHTIHVPTAKAGAREQPITAELTAMVLEAREHAKDPAGMIFPVRKKGVSKKGFRYMTKGFRRSVKRAGLPERSVTPHTMRRTAITRLIVAGVDLPTIQKISGHKTLKMLLRYFHVHGEHVHTAIAHLAIKPVDAKAAILGTVTHGLHMHPEEAWPDGMFSGGNSASISAS